jgi:hypothetical protein
MSSIEKRTRRTSRWAAWSAGAFLAITITGCSIQAGTDATPAPVPLPPPTGGPVPGSLTLRWSVDEVTDPNVCLMGNAATFDVILRTTAGQFVGEFQASCTSFGTTISSLVPGDYTGSAMLLDSSGQPRTTSVYIQTFTIFDNSNLVVDLDFPANSFL